MQVQRAFGLEHRLARVVHSPHPQGEDQGLAANGGVAETTRGAHEGLQGRFFSAVVIRDRNFDRLTGQLTSQKL